MGFKDAMEAKNRPVNSEDVLFGGLQEDDGYKSMSALIEKDQLPDAIFCVNDPVAIGAFRKLKEAGLRIPDQVAIVGFSNQNALVNLLEPPLTTVDQPAFVMGEKTAELLLHEIENKDNKNLPKTEILETELIVRKSA